MFENGYDDTGPDTEPILGVAKASFCGGPTMVDTTGPKKLHLSEKYKVGSSLLGITSVSDHVVLLHLFHLGCSRRTYRKGKDDFLFSHRILL